MSGEHNGFDHCQDCRGAFRAVRAREALAQLVNDNHMCTRPWRELRRNEPSWTRSNGDDFAIAEAYRAADALLEAGFSLHEGVSSVG